MIVSSSPGQVGTTSGREDLWPSARSYVCSPSSTCLPKASKDVSMLDHSMSLRMMAKAHGVESYELGLSSGKLILIPL